MSLLPIDTIFQDKKTRTRVRGNIRKTEGVLKELSNTDLEGYEIHMGISKLQVGLPPMASITKLENGI